MWDLPLGSEDVSDSSLPGFPTTDSAMGSRPRQSRGARKRRMPRQPINRRKRVVIVVLMVATVVAAYLIFWPKPPQASFSPDPFSVGDQRVSVPGEIVDITISNVGERLMPISLVTVAEDPQSEFELKQDSCAGRQLEPQQSCVATIAFMPAEMGERLASLEVHAEMPNSPARIEISGLGIAPLIEISPSTLSFGSQSVGSTSKSKTVTLRNSGTAPLQIAGLELQGGGAKDFRRQRDKCSKETLSPKDTCTVEFSFAPRAAGVRSVDLAISSDSLQEPADFRISGEGIWTGAAFAVEPKNLRFADYLVGSDQMKQRIVITNRQSSAIRGLEVDLVSETAAYSVTKESCSGRSIAPGESCTVYVGFSAPDEGDFSALLQLGDQRLGVFGVELQGRGVAPRWVLSTDALDLGTVRVGSKSELLGVELANEGSAAARVSSVEIRGVDSNRFRKQRDGCAGSSVAPGTSCTVEIMFVADREGAHQAKLRMQTEAGASPEPVTLSALAAAPRLSLDLEMVEFGQVHRTTLQEVILTASNPGTAPLQMDGFSLAGSAPESFRVLGGTCFPQAAVPPKQRCTVRLGFDPIAEGRSTARLQIEHDGISGPKTVPLSGTGLAPPSPEIYLSTSGLDFGPQPVGERSPILTVTVNIAGTGHLRFESFEIDGTDEGDFQIVPATCDAAPSLVPGSSCAVGVRMVPAVSGPRRARLVIRHNAGARVSTVELLGEGLGGGS